jgi:hypothetical protein
MQMESPVVRARELRRYELLEVAARSRLAARAETHRREKLTAPNPSASINKVCAVVASLGWKRGREFQTPVLGADPVG